MSSPFLAKGTTPCLVNCSVISERNAPDLAKESADFAIYTLVMRGPLMIDLPARGDRHNASSPVEFDYQPADEPHGG